MNIISGKAFIRTKKSDTLCIMGSGSSINTITCKQWEFIKNNDSVAFNWYCWKETPIIPKYYIINAQGVRNIEQNTPYNWQTFLSKYKAEYVIIVKQAKGKHIVYNYEEKIKRIHQDGIVIDYRKYRKPPIYTDVLKNPIDNIVTFFSAIGYPIHLAVWMGYKTVIFFGVDLYDNHYFWDEGKEFDFLKLDGIKASQPFAHKTDVITGILNVKLITPSINWLVHNKKSLLTSILPTWDYE